MAQRRMFSLKIVSSDAFLDMPVSARELYFQLGMYSDDDGFISPKKVVRMIGASDDDLKLLIAKRFVIPFENGVVVIKHWLINNLIRKDFYQETTYLEEKSKLEIKENKSYTIKDENSLILAPCQQNVNNLSTQVRLGKDRLGKDRIDNTPVDKQRDSSEIKTWKRPPVEKQTEHQRIIYFLEDTLNTKIVNWPKQTTAVKKMLQAGYNEEQIKFSIKHMAEKDFYRDKGFDLMTVSNEIARIKASVRKGAIKNGMAKTV